jgi:hydroxymethylpyrimidine pyrophosphatase-like HAD family hydrolase
MSLQEGKPSTQTGVEESLKSVDTRNKVILLDIDGVICEPQTPVSDTMQGALHRLSRHYQVYFVTGNNYVKTVDILNGPIAHFMGVFCNNGDDLRTMRGKLMWKDDVTPPLPPQIERTLHYMLKDYPDHYGNRIEWRSPRMLNFSRIGRYAPYTVRQEHDASWRDDTIAALKVIWPGVDVAKGGAVSIDIFSKGADKSRAAQYILDRGKEFIFLGDKMEEGGNDYPVKRISDACPKNVSLKVSGVDHTLEVIEYLLSR